MKSNSHNAIRAMVILGIFGCMPLQSLGENFSPFQTNSGINCYTPVTKKSSSKTTDVKPKRHNILDQRTRDEKRALENPFSVTLYQPTYVLPLYYSRSPYRTIYQGTTPENQAIDPYDLKFQLSFKVPVWQNILGSSTLFFAYTQLSYWQAYNNSPFFRETNYEPEMFVATPIHNIHINNWHLNFINVGAMHQSNGRGGPLERSWNRAYVEGIAANGHCLVSLKPWLISRDSSLAKHNPDIASYMGYGRILTACKIADQTFSVEATNVIESDFSRAGITAGWSFPLTKHLNGYLQVFSGYGQSLIEYNHYTNSIGVGISLGNWV